MTNAALERLTAREWLLPLGNGGYASSTVGGPETRSYHGLLVAAYPPPKGRVLMVTHVDARFLPKGETAWIDLSTRLYDPGVLHPRGFERLQSFTAEPHPTWTHRAGANVLSETLRGERGRNAVSLSWHLLAGGGGILELRPFLNGRSHHGGRGPVRGRLQRIGERLCWQPEDETGAEPVWIETSADVIEEPVLHERFLHAEEKRRGYTYLEDIESPFILRIELSPEAGRRNVVVRFGDREAIEDRDEGDDADAASANVAAQSLAERLRRATLAPVIRHPGSEAVGILAGYHWFNEWGRDTMIALPGAVLASADPNLGFHVLTAWSRRISHGMLPNRLRESETDDLFNSADAPLFFIRAVDIIHREAPFSAEQQRVLVAAIGKIVTAYLDGTRYGIGVDSVDGLLAAGEAGTQLTWMDAKIGDDVVTPRRGKCVELNALLFTGLRFFVDFASSLDEAKSIIERARRAAGEIKQSFSRRFWCEERGYLRDVVGDSDDESLRPNQLFALAAGELIDRESALRALATIEAELLTPFGLRTLSPRDPRYRGRYCGDAETRDRAYHQGTVWPWLLGPYADAVLALRGTKQSLREALGDCFTAFERHLDDAGIGHVSEVFDGDEPHLPGGAIAQAWSAAELYRVARLALTV